MRAQLKRYDENTKLQLVATVVMPEFEPGNHPKIVSYLGKYYLPVETDAFLIEIRGEDYEHCVYIAASVYDFDSNSNRYAQVVTVIPGSAADVPPPQTPGTC